MFSHQQCILLLAVGPRKQVRIQEANYLLTVSLFISACPLRPHLKTTFSMEILGSLQTYVILPAWKRSWHSNVLALELIFTFHISLRCCSLYPVWSPEGLVTCLLICRSMWSKRRSMMSLTPLIITNTAKQTCHYFCLELYSVC